MSWKNILIVATMVLCGAGLAHGQTEWTQYADNPVFGPGPPGSYEEGGSYMNAVVFDGDTHHMWFTVFLENGAEIGHATSPDGIEWTADPANPVLAAGDAGRWDDWGLLAAAVLHDGTHFHMWYDGTNNVDFIERIGYATSPDGTVWTKYEANPVMTAGPAGSWNDTAVIPTRVILDDGTYRMWFNGFDNYWGDGTVAKIGYAESTDGVGWTVNPQPIFAGSGLPGSWDADIVLSPYVIHDGSTYHMWYAGGPDADDWMSMDIGYAYSNDGIEWTRHRDNPVLAQEGLQTSIANVYHDGSMWNMWYAYWDGEANQVGYATSDCCAGVAALSHMRFIPAAAIASGAEGAYFRTDVDVNNASAGLAQYKFLWLPRRQDNSDPVTSEIFYLGQSKSIRYSNVLSEVLGLEPDSLGALAVMSSSPDLLVMSRTYNSANANANGTFGQGIPAILVDDFIHGMTQRRRRIVFGTENAEMRFNVGCQNGTPEPMFVDLSLFRDDGSFLESKRMLLFPWGNDQLNRIFKEYEPVNGYVDVSASHDTSFYCYGSLLDNTTSDPTTIPPQ